MRVSRSAWMLLPRRRRVGRDVLRKLRQVGREGAVATRRGLVSSAAPTCVARAMLIHGWVFHEQMGAQTATSSASAALI